MDYLDALDHMLQELAEAKRLLSPAAYILLLLLINEHINNELRK